MSDKFYYKANTTSKEEAEKRMKERIMETKDRIKMQLFQEQMEKDRKK